MSTLQDFLNANPINDLTDEVVVSDRFKDKEGNLLKFKIKAMTNAENSSYRQQAMRINAKKQDVQFDSAKYASQIVINHTLDPNFKDAESIQKLGCATPEQYLNKVLLPGEIDRLAQAIQELSGFKDMDDLVEEAKN